MRVMHVCLSCPYIPGQLYQENELIRQSVLDGHAVLVVTSTEIHEYEGNVTPLRARRFKGPEGAEVIRLPYRFWPSPLARKIRAHKGLKAVLQGYAPEAILFHGTCGWEVGTVAKYSRENPDVLLYIDSHEDWNNSARNWLSENILHRIYYRFCLRKALGIARKILCVSTESIEFVKDVYQVPTEMLEFYPLGGRPVPDDEYIRRRRETREGLGLNDGQIVIVQSGKMTPRKKLEYALESFWKVDNPDLRFIIAGSIPIEICEEIMRLINRDGRVRFIGWQGSDEMTSLLCAADIYLQPGSQSVTMQHSLCCRCAAVLDDVPAHAAYREGVAYFLSQPEDLENIFSGMDIQQILKAGVAGYDLAKRMLDYQVLAKRILRA